MLLTLPLLKAGLTAQTLGKNAGGYTAADNNGPLADALLTDLIEETEGALQQALGWQIEATHAVETLCGTGTNVLQSRYWPICSVAHIYIVSPGTPAVNLTDVWNGNSVVVTYETGQLLNYNPFAFQAVGYLTLFPRGAPVQLDYVYGYAMANITANAALGATSLTVDNPLGFRPGADYRIWDGASSEVVTTANTYVAGANPVTLAAATKYAHNTATCQAVSDMPPALVRAARRIVERRVLGRDSRALAGLKSKISGQSGSNYTESYVEVPEISPAELDALSKWSRVDGVIV